MTEPAPALVNIGCAQSSGSTALAHVLDRHPGIACGAEMFLFCHPLLYDDYARFIRRRRLLRIIGVCGHPYSGNRALFRHLRDFSLTKPQMWRWARQADSLPALAARVHEHIRRLTGKPIWAEKTPWNIRVVGKFLTAFPSAKVIHLVRDPRDVILSLRTRDRQTGLLPAAENWLTSAAAVAPFRGHPNVLEVRYEDLCTAADAALQRICGFLNVPFDPVCLRADAAGSRGLNRWQGHPSWRQRPGESFSPASVGRHVGSGIDWTLLARVRLSVEFAALLGTRQWTIPELARTYGYDLPEPAGAARSVGVSTLGGASVAGSGFRPFPMPRRLDPVRRLLDRLLGMPQYMTQIELAGEPF